MESNAINRPTALADKVSNQVGSIRGSIDPEFAECVKQGLTASPKFLMSRFFYDARGDQLFQHIMGSPEYYLSDCETEILDQQGARIAVALAGVDDFELVELGSGDGSKFHFLLDALHARGQAFTYRPLDISANVLELLADALMPSRPWLNMQALAVNYMDWLKVPHAGNTRRVFAFMGSNLGNFTREGAVEFLGTISAAMHENDALLIGLDLKKPPETIMAAYNDAGGFTRDFNLNLLQRINRELGGQFDIGQFSHEPEYDPLSGAARSFLKSKVSQEVRIEGIQMAIPFAQGEKIFMEISQKYDQAMINQIARASGFEVTRTFYDTRNWFTDQIWHPVKENIKP